MTLDDFITTARNRLENVFQTYLVAAPQPATQLKKSIAYAALDGGKRIRPLLVYLSGRALGASWENLDAAASAIEFIHVYSLIHDDLPAMDNSDLRRGKPTCHKVFGDALAILAGDGLQPLAFDILADHPSDLGAAVRLQMIKTLSQASGIHGMVAGQTLDIEGVRDLDTLTQMYRLKTGALLMASVKLGAIAANADSAALETFAANIGLAFQIQDDLLDIEGTSQITGKPQGIDNINQKITYPSLLGVQESRAYVNILFEEALASLAYLGETAALLQEFSVRLLNRSQ
jgi:farnesyl diphosphate synthase